VGPQSRVPVQVRLQLLFPQLLCGACAACALEGLSFLFPSLTRITCALSRTRMWEATSVARGVAPVQEFPRRVKEGSQSEPHSPPRGTSRWASRHLSTFCAWVSPRDSRLVHNRPGPLLRSLCSLLAAFPCFAFSFPVE